MACILPKMVFEEERNMELQELYRLIGLEPEMVMILERTGRELDLGPISVLLERLTDRETAQEAYEELCSCLSEDEDQIKMLYCQLECAGRTAAKYREKQISMEIFTDTMKCFSRFLEECRVKNGRMFFDRGWWTWRQISMRIFRIGELEYELLEGNGPSVGIHIPSDADLSGAAVDDSLRRAGAFLERHYPQYAGGSFTCESWLLSPALRPLLPESSNIRAFQDRFRIVREHWEDLGYMEWLFRVPPNTKAQDLPEQTGLQKRAKRVILDGGRIGAAEGVML